MFNKKYLALFLTLGTIFAEHSAHASYEDSEWFLSLPAEKQDFLRRIEKNVVDLCIPDKLYDDSDCYSSRKGKLEREFPKDRMSVTLMAKAMILGVF
ncbi:hypothetical protein [Holospora curviuscula]|uniref:Uncharacterized protein n=1 Tax=Holospora curviuscula TaxID=1082868 RepID=A0A2S5RA91_9PROT|nr:hypothetical protein [Holospora curviuscula]PPE04228.1 hypothetical protein HCUR_00419 [Holospora curviuscula]